MKNYILTSLLLVLAASPCYPADFACGNTGVTIATWGERETAGAKIVFADTERETSLCYRDIDFIGAECTQDAKGNEMVVFQAYCGGSGCKDLDNYGIFDPRRFRLLLVPLPDNRQQASKILGREVKTVKKMIPVGGR